MKVLVSMPTEVYGEYLILKNGVVIRAQDGNSKQDMVEILCEGQRAKFLVDFATLVFPDAVPYIEKSFTLAEGDSD